MTFQIIRKNVFTHYSLLLFLVSFFTGVRSSIWSISTCLNVGIFLGFYSVPALDSTAYRRMALKNGWSMRVFHICNFVLHGIPFIVSIMAIPISINWRHGVISIILHILWAFTTEDNGLFLNKTYVSMNIDSWRILWYIAFASELLWPIFCIIIK